MDIFQIAQKAKEIFFFLKDFLLSIDWLKILFLIKILFIFISIVLFVGIIVVIIKSNLLSRTRQTVEILTKPSIKTSGKFLKKWKKIEKRLKSSQEIEWKLAIIEADRFFDNLLKKIGYLGKNMEERLAQITPEQIANIDKIKEVHKTRNEIVHKPDYQLQRPIAEKSIREIKKALEELEVL